MMRTRHSLFTPALLLAAMAWSTCGVMSTFEVPEPALILLENYCYECHESGLEKGGVKFDGLGELSQGERLDLFNLAAEHVYSGEMPPRKADQPSEEERQQLFVWMKGELESHGAYKLEDKMRHYKYANYLDHDKLFSGEIKDKPYTRARRRACP